MNRAILLLFALLILPACDKVENPPQHVLGVEPAIVTVSHSTGNATYVQLAASGDSVYAVWVDDRTGGPRYFANASNDAGITWSSTDTEVVPLALGFPPVLRCDGDVACLAWMDNADIYFRSTTDGGATWSAAAVIDTSGGTASSVDLWVSGLDVHVVWTQGNDTQYRASPDAGATWPTAAVVISTGFAYNAAIIGSGLDLYAAWAQFFGANDYRLYFRRSPDGGVNWDPGIDLNGAGIGNQVGTPKLFLDGTNVAAVWSTSYYDDLALQYTSASTHSNASADGGATWLPAAVNIHPTMGAFTYGAGFQSGSTLFACMTYAYGQYGNYPVPGTWVKTSTDFGATWSASEHAVGIASGFSGPVFAAFEDELLAVAYEPDPPGPEVFLKQSVGGSFSAGAAIAIGQATTAGSPAAAAGNRPYAAWTDTSGTTNVIMINRNLP